MWRDFNATNAAGTCLWCGQRLRRPMTVDWKLFERPEGGFSQGPDLSTRRPLHDKPGDYGDGFFCGLRCAYSFAVRQAELGQRLVKKRSVA